MDTTWMVVLKWEFKGWHKTALMLYARDEAQVLQRLYMAAPSTFLRATEREIHICPSSKLLEAMQELQEVKFEGDRKELAA